MVLVGGCAAAAVWVSLGRLQFAPAPEELLREARSAMRSGDYRRAEQFARRIRAGAAEYPDAMLVVGESLTRRREFQSAIEAYTAIPEDDSDQSITALYCTGDLLFHLGVAGRAEQSYRRVLARRPNDPFTHEQLASLLTTFGRRWEAIPHLFELVRQNRANAERLLLLGSTEAVMALTTSLDRFRRAAPDDPLPELALARDALVKNDPQAAQRHAHAVLRADSGLIEAWAVLGRALVNGPQSAFYDWHARVTPAAAEHPDVWMARGLRATIQSEPRVAVRCFWEAVRRAPDSRAANYHLGQALLHVDPDLRDQAAPFLDRAAQLEQFEGLLALIYVGRDSLPHLRRAATQAESLGRLWEAAGWCREELKIQPRLDAALRQLQRLEPQLTYDLPRTLGTANPTQRVDLSSYPLPEWRGSTVNDHGSAETTIRAATVHFVDLAAQAGIDFLYFNGGEIPRDGKLIFQTLGGGIAVLDYDGDLWPDLHLTQGRPWPPDDSRHDYTDRFYRNRGDGRFEDVTVSAGLLDYDFSHGAAAGDFDDDGFPDLYLAHLGANRLMHNNGDGTFTDVTRAAGLSGEHLTSGCLVADLNGDGYPDLFDVNYVVAAEAFHRVCANDGRSYSCNPRLFTADHNRLWISLGDGRFEDITESAGILAPDGRGLGVVAFDPGETGLLNLFVANDTTANFYFQNITPHRGGLPRFRETAVEAGLAFDADGRAQACMGVAAGDADGDGLLDLYVTNFYEEGSTLYRQRGSEYFEDVTRRFGLYEPSRLQLGFGTQFLDGDLDGWPDLIVTNGHIDDFTDRGTPYQMPPQFYRNDNGVRFELLPPEELGPFFERRCLGRSLARLDWNRDGREDVVISHLDVPVALLANRTSAVGRHLALRLVGTAGSRDAIGTTLRVTAGGRTWVRQLTAGDGYQVSNERQLVFGLGKADRIDRLSVRWPSGNLQSFNDLAVDQQLLIVEGRPQVIRLR